MSNIDSESELSESESSANESEISEILDNEGNIDSDDNERDEDEYIETNPLEGELLKENEDENDCFYDIEQEEQVNNPQTKVVSKEDRITSPYLTDYERVRVLGTRAKQISLGAKILVEGIDVKTMSPFEIAKIELSKGTIPFIIRRPLPNGQIEEWKISELNKIK